MKGREGERQGKERARSAWWRQGREEGREGEKDRPACDGLNDGVVVVPA